MKDKELYFTATKKKTILFTAPLHLSTGYMEGTPVYKWQMKKHLFSNFCKWIRDLFFEKVTYGLTHKTLREAYFSLDKDCNLVKVKQPTINTETEKLEERIGVSISVFENNLEVRIN